MKKLASGLILIALVFLAACARQAVTTPRSPEADEAAFAVDMDGSDDGTTNTTAAAPAAKPSAAAPTELRALQAMRSVNFSFSGDYLSLGVNSEEYAGAAGSADRDWDSTVDLGHTGTEEGEDWRRAEDPASTEAYDHIIENPYQVVTLNPLSTFSIDVDTASYSNMRRFLTNNQMPPRGSVRIEELVNYFDYHYSPPANGDPFSVHTEVAACPWAPDHRLVRIGLKGKVVEQSERPAYNLVFLIDVSGSMQSVNKLAYVKEGLKMLAGQLDGRDTVSMVVYAGSSGLVLPPTSGADQTAIIDALDRLEAGGSTNGGAGIQLAYKTAAENYNKSGVNRVVLCTDGDFNVGTTDQGSLVEMIEEKAKTGVFLSVLGFGMGNYKDSTLEKLADKGNGNYAYIDTINEAQKVLVEEMGATLITIAKDVKIQIEFNPAKVAAYRLIGYENRMLRKEDFNDDTKDAGEIGAGHTVTALYEIIPYGMDVPGVEPDELKYQETAELTNEAYSDDLLTLKLRHKLPDGVTSKMWEYAVVDDGRQFNWASGDFRFAAAVAAFGMLLRDSEYKGAATFDDVENIAAGSLGEDAFGYRSEFVELVKAAKGLAGQQG